MQSETREITRSYNGQDQIDLMEMLEDYSVTVGSYYGSGSDRYLYELYIFTGLFCEDHLCSQKDRRYIGRFFSDKETQQFGRNNYRCSGIQR